MAPIHDEVGGQASIRALACELDGLDVLAPTDLDERIDLVASAAQVRGTGDLGERPVVVLTKSAPEDLPAPYDQRVAMAWLAMQNEIASLSTRGVQRTVPGSGHDIHLDQPEEVVRAIEDVLTAIAEGPHAWPGDPEVSTEGAEP